MFGNAIADQFSALFIQFDLRQHRTMGAAGFGGSFAPIVQYEKWEIHKVFPHFPYFRLGQNLAPNLLAPLCGIALILVQIHSTASISGIHCRIYLAGEINLAEVFCKSFPDILVLHLVHCINLTYLCQINYLI